MLNHRRFGQNDSSSVVDQSRLPSSDSLLTTLRRLLDRVHRDITSASGPAGIQRAVDQLFRGLASIRRDATPEQWREAIAFGQSHSICRVVHQDPFTARAFRKPRGYAGDAVMMDYIYGRDENWEPPVASETGRAIFDYTTAAPASAGVRERRCYVAELLDEVARRRSGTDVLAVAAGHLREAMLSCGIRRRRFGRFLAMDADPESLCEIEKSYGFYGVTAIAADIRKMLTGRLDLGSFDLIYSTGLYDYLADSTAQRLTANLFQSLRPGGRLVIANFLPGIRDVGYMEMFMDWHLIYRSRADMLKLADRVPQAQCGEVVVVAEENENIVILELTKR